MCGEALGWGMRDANARTADLRGDFSDDAMPALNGGEGCVSYPARKGFSQE
jgi:hypothetical protein